MLRESRRGELADMWRGGGVLVEPGECCVGVGADTVVVPVDSVSVATDSNC
jgi:hypothetical protein